MKRVLITGENSYIGTSFDTYMKQYQNDYIIDTISVRDNMWKSLDFSKYDVVFHVAGIVHQNEKKIQEKLYFDINYHLAIKIAEKAKKETVKQFIFLSTMSVYGITEGPIEKNTVPSPNNSYGKSKLSAEKTLKKLKSPDFLITIIRPPMVYGKGCKGNYVSLSNFANRVFLFPNIVNKRSMIYIGNLNYVVKTVIDRQCDGIFCPQNMNFVNTSDLFKTIRSTHNKKTFLSKLAGFILLKLKSINIVNKIFGDLYYNFFDFECLPFSFDESIEQTEVKK